MVDRPTHRNTDMQATEDHAKTTDRSLYDAIPYPRYVFPQTAPDNLAVLSTLHGLEPAQVSRCRYLELGCGNGTNIAAFASRYPDSTFVGIDLAETHISSAKQMADELDLKNVEFISADLMNIDPASLGQFDFVVAHGLFSWVPDDVRERVLELMRQCVKTSGVGYISYNALPGCYLRKIGWDLLRFGTRKIENPKEKIQAALSIADFVAREIPEDSPHRSIYQLMTAELASRRPENILHDDLSELNRPFYFFEFAELLEAHGLKFLCEADPRSNGDGKLSAPARDELDRISSGPIEREQFVDFLDFASFRQCVISHAGAQVSGALSADRLKELFCEWSLRPELADTPRGSDSTVTFRFEDTSVETDHPLTAYILSAMSRTSPLPIGIGNSINDFYSEMQRAELNGVSERQTLDFLLDLYRSGFVRLFTQQPPIDCKSVNKPRVHGFARWQAMNGLDTFTTLLGENIAFGNDIVRLLVILLDGTRDRQSVTNEVLDRLQIPPDQTEKARSSIPEIVNANIEQLRQLGVFAC
jgi:SAM-dependent methyltransferase